MKTLILLSAFVASTAFAHEPYLAPEKLDKVKVEDHQKSIVKEMPSQEIICNEGKCELGTVMRKEKVYTYSHSVITFYLDDKKYTIKFEK